MYRLSFILRRINALCEKYKTLVGEAKEVFLDKYNQHIILNVNMMHNNLKQMTKLDPHMKIVLCQQVLTYKVYYNQLVPWLLRCITVVNCVYKFMCV